MLNGKLMTIWPMLITIAMLGVAWGAFGSRLDTIERDLTDIKIAVDSLDYVDRIHKLELKWAEWEGVLKARAPDYALDLRTRVEAAVVSSASVGSSTAVSTP